MPAQPHGTMRPGSLVVALGFGFIVFGGYDLIVYGAAVPAVLANRGWGLTPTRIGAIVGADRFGGRTVTTCLFVIAAISLGLLAIPGPLAVTFVLVVVAGASALGNQSVLLGYVAMHYGGNSRATALGVIFGGGRLGAAAGPLLVGVLISSGVGLGGNSVTLSLVALLAAAATFSVPSIFDFILRSDHRALDTSTTL